MIFIFIFNKFISRTWILKPFFFFFRLFIGCSVSHLLSSSLMQCVKPKTAIMYMETPLFLLHMSNEILQKFKEHMTSEAEVCNWWKCHISYIYKNIKFYFRNMDYHLKIMMQWTVLILLWSKNKWNIILITYSLLSFKMTTFSICKLDSNFGALFAKTKQG